MTDIDRILAEELSDTSVEPWQPGNVARASIDSLTHPKHAAARAAAGFSATSQPLERKPMGAAFRRRARREHFDAIVDVALDRAAAGSIKHMEFVRDSVDGKPGTSDRVDDADHGGDYREVLLTIRERVRLKAADDSDIT
jgi:hypothetical protein